MEATILKWHKKPGDKVEQDETILEIATDKVDSEVPSTAEGTIEEILFNENDVVPIGTVIARIKTGAESNAHQPSQQPSQPQSSRHEYEEANVVEDVPYTPSDTRQPSAGNGVRFYSPLVLNIAASEGVAMSELENIPGTGQDGRVSKKDILQYIEQRKTGSHKPQAPRQEPSQRPVVVFEDEKSSGGSQLAAQNSQLAPYQGNVEIVEMDRMRKMIAKHMIHSVQTSAHVTSFSECDVTNMVLWREKMKKEFEKREGEK